MEDQDRTEPQTGAEDNPTPTPPETPAEQPVADEPVEETAASAGDDAPAADAAPAADDAAATEEPAGEAVAEAAEDNLPGGEDDDEAVGGARERDPNYIPGADLEPDLVSETDAALGEPDPLMEEIEAAAEPEQDDADTTPIADAAIDLAADARYRATGRRKTAVARVILRPGTGQYTINGKPLEEFFPRPTLLRQIRQPLETVGYADRMDVVATMQGGGVSAQAGALRHGISRALQEADPNLRGELKRRGFLTRDARAKERKKAGLKKARKRPQFSKR